MNAEDVRGVHGAMMDHVRAARWNDAAALVARLPGSADDLNGGALADLWWTFCEELGDRMAASDRACASRLYDLALVSFVKEGTQATGAGEGMMSLANVKRVEAKRAALNAGGPLV